MPYSSAFTTPLGYTPHPTPISIPNLSHRATTLTGKAIITRQFHRTTAPPPPLAVKLTIFKTFHRFESSPWIVFMAYYRQCGRNILRQITKENTLLHCSDRIANPLLYVAQGLRYRKLEVILTTSIDKLGKAGETVAVAPGYFRNYLMPKLLAVPNIDKYAHLIREQRKIYQPEEVEEVKVVKETQEDKMKEYQAAAKRLNNAKLVLRRFIKVDNELRAPVTKDEIVSEVARQLCVQIESANLHLPSPLSSLGEFEVPLLLPRSIPLPEGKVHWTLQVKVRRV